MKKIFVLLITILLSISLYGQDMMITGVIDGPLAGGNPKAVELYVINNIANLSILGIGSANNGGGTDGQEFTFPAVAATAGTYIYVAYNAVEFLNFMGFAADYSGVGAANINGDDAIELFQSGSVIDVFGDINVDGTGQPWEYTDGWAYRKDNTGPDASTFVLSNWTFSSPDALDGELNNATATTPFPTADYALPVELAYFTAKNSINGTILNWRTESEIENLGFFIERKTSGNDWKEIVSYKNDRALFGQGTVSYSTDYKYVDALVQQGNTYEYRLADVDYDGIITYHSSRKVTIENSPLLSKVEAFSTMAYPNPFNPTTTIRYSVPTNETEVSVTIYDVSGNFIKNLVNQTQNVGWYETQWNGVNSFGKDVPGGVYLSRVTIENQAKTTKLILLK